MPTPQENALRRKRARVISKILTQSINENFLLTLFGAEKKDEAESPFTAAVRAGAAKSGVDAVRRAATVFKPSSGQSWSEIADWVIDYEKNERKRRVFHGY